MRKHAGKFYDLYDGGERWPRSVVSAVDKHMTEGEAEKAHSRVGRSRTRAGVCGVGKSGVEGEMSEYMRMSR
jgi:hypothetical protein